LSEKGKAWAGVTVSDPNLLEITRQIVGALSWRGPLEVEVLKSDQDDRYYLLEVNPRFPAWVFLCQAAGQNLPWALTRLALGEEVPPFGSYEVGVGFVRSARDLIVSQDEFAAIYSLGEIRR
jgi:carbamoyl-phosphate synthase large subunit